PSAPGSTTAQQPAEVVSSTGDSRIKASPLARKIAKEKGIDLSTITGTGDGGRVVRRDIEHAKPASAATSKTTTPVLTTGEEGYTDTPVSQMRKTIARRLSESKFSAPHFYLRMTITMDEAMKARTAINQVSPVKVSF